ncbi:hypothetical protein EVJ58_g3714 [Rhodofomes roseus]|uniref:Cytochrome P450 n=1 Tax=Rhodofomes roseus TaxID=34475 RepID=A0A4Y9YM41_9APHY|nr:hypothetical protein EVJ58_g3714 [Rhodofomes roseus]
MFVAGFVAFLSTFMPERTATVVACTLPMVMLAAWLFMMLTEKVEGDLPVTLPECPLRNISPFFRRRFDFLRRGQHLTGESIYRFKLLRNTVVVASGAPGRRDFFTSRNLDLGAGFKVLSGIDDPLQPMLDNRDDRAVIIGFIMGLLVAGARSTGTTASWFITFLASHPTWKDKAMTEIRGLLASHSDTHGTPHIPSTTGTDPSPAALSLASLSGALSSIPLNAWETQTPTLDAIIRETLRLAQPHTALRQNTSPSPVLLAGKAVPPRRVRHLPLRGRASQRGALPGPMAVRPRAAAEQDAVRVGRLGAQARACVWASASRASS